MTKARGAALGFAWLLIGNLASPIAGLVVTTVIARELGADGRGAVAGATAPLLLFMGALTLGLPEAATHFVAKGMRPRSRTFLWLLMLTVALGGLGALLSAGIGSATPAPVGPLMVLSGMALPLALAVGVMRAVAIGRQQWRLVMNEKIVGAGARVVGISSLAASGHLTDWSATVVIAVGTFIGGLCYLLLTRRPQAGDERPTSMHEIYKFGGVVWVGLLGGALMARLDQLLMVPLSTLNELGLYAVAVTVSEVGLIANSAIRDIVFARESRAPHDKFVASAVRVSTLLTTIGSLAIAGGAVWLMAPLFGTEFSGAIPPTIILLIGIVLGNPGSVSAAALTARGFPLVRTLAIWSAVVLNVLLIFLLTPPLGAVGTAMATAIATVASGATCALILTSKSSISMRDLLGVHREDLAQARALFRRRERMES